MGCKRNDKESGDQKPTAGAKLRVWLIYNKPKCDRKRNLVPMHQSTKGGPSQLQRKLCSLVADL